MINYNDNPIIVDVNYRRNKKQKVLYVLSFPKIQLECTDPESNKWRCPRCKNSYELYNQINEFSDELESRHSEESEFDDDVGLLVAEDEFSKEDDDTSKSDIPIPNYMKYSETTKVTYFREE